MTRNTLRISTARQPAGRPLRSVTLMPTRAFPMVSPNSPSSRAKYAIAVTQSQTASTVVVLVKDE